MDFSRLITRRQSVRKYADRPVPEELLEHLIEAVRLSPSASNSQPWRLILVTEPALKDRVARATFSRLVSFNRFAVQAPVLAVLVVEKPKVITQIGGRLKDRDFPLIDIGIAAAHFCLQAADLGLGTCMLGWFDEPRIREMLHIPALRRIGSSSPSATRRKRKSGRNSANAQAHAAATATRGNRRKLRRASSVFSLLVRAGNAGVRMPWAGAIPGENAEPLTRSR